MKVVSKTKLSDSATSYNIKIDPEDLSDNETSEERYSRYLDKLRKDANSARATANGGASSGAG